MTDKVDARGVLFKDEGYAIQGAIFEVYREMGCGFLEAVYHECLTKEFNRRKIPFSSQMELNLNYKNQPLDQKYKPDFICYDKVIVEIKAVNKLTPVHEAQILNYLKGARVRLGILANFGYHPKVEIKRLVL